jgi:hypothetical protein
MISKYTTCLLLTLSVLVCGASTSYADARENKIKLFTKQLKALPERSAPTARITALVKKLVKLMPGKATQYYLLGLRKSGTPDAAGDAYSKKLNAEIQKLLRNSDLSQSDKDATVRRLNKTERLYVPPAASPTPAPYDAMLWQTSSLVA